MNFTTDNGIRITAIPEDIVSNKSLVKDTVEMVDNDSDDSVLALKFLPFELMKGCV